MVKIGVTFEELLQRQATQGSFGDAEATAAALRLGRTLCQGEPARYIRRTPKGRILEVSSSPTPDGGFIVIHSDVTELLEAQGAAADRAALLQLMLDSMRHGIALFDRDRRLVTANALTAAFNGVSTAALVQAGRWWISPPISSRPGPSRPRRCGRRWRTITPGPCGGAGKARMAG